MEFQTVENIKITINLLQKFYNLIWYKFDWCDINNIINKYLNCFYTIGETLIWKTHVVKFVVSLTSLFNF